MANQEENLKQIVSHAKENGFVFPSIGLSERIDLAQYDRRDMGLFQNLWPATFDL